MGKSKLDAKSTTKLGKKRVDDAIEVEPFYASPLYHFLAPFRSAENQWLNVYIILLFALIVRCAIGLGPYSGMNEGPMFGDFEAQRHWMELTQHLPMSKWYFYDLQYWGLDYPPLTAYHSYICGLIGKFINPSWFALDESRGTETKKLKTFMRLTAIASEVIFYIPGIVYFTTWVGKKRNQSPVGQYIAGAAILFQPCLMLIDHGHFQYNSVMLGLTVYAINNLLDDMYAPAAIFFVLSICFKQMSLYYSPFFFSYLLGRSLFRKQFFNFSRFSNIAISTVLTFFAVFSPLYIFGGGKRNILQSIHRIFPFARGIFEDKVANFWCVTNVIMKYKTNYAQEQLQLYSLVLTVVGFFPAMLIILWFPKKHLIPYALAACSMSFYLFSFQVHEKTILVPLLPITLLYSSTDWNVLSMVCWINNVALFTLWPLLKKDGLFLQYGVCFILSNWLIGNFSFITPNFLPKILTPGPPIQDLDVPYRRRSLLPHNILWKIIIVLSYIAMVAIHAVELLIDPPAQYPDLWVLLNCVLGFACFTLFWLWNYYKIFTLANKNLQYL